MTFQHRSAFSLVIALVLFAGTASAQLAVPRPPTVEPGRQDQRLRIENEMPPVGNDSIITVPNEAGKEQPLADKVTFTLKGIVFENLSVFTEDQLRSEYESYIGKEVTLNTLREIATRITTRYRNAGYILSRAVVPPQHIKDGMVKIRIVEGYINKVLFEGAPQSGLLAEYADKIRSAKPLDAATLERYLLLMDDLPGVSAHAVLRPSQEAPGASDVVVTMTEKMINGSLTLDNRGSRYMGPIQEGATVNGNNLLGLYDRTQLHGVLTGDPKELQYGEIVHEEQLDSEGTKLALSAARTHTRPGYRLSPFDINGQDTIYSAAISHPFIRSRQTNLFGDARIDVRDTYTDSLGAKLYDDRLRVLRVGGAYDFVDSWSAVNKVQSEISKGFDWDAGAAAHSRATGDPSFLKATAQASRLQPISGPFSLYVAASGQLSANTLLAAEEFGIGGEPFGSAYDPSEIVGDSGLAGRAELQFSRSGDLEIIPTYQFYGFYDIGKVWIRAAQAGQKSEASLASAGLGTRFNILEPVSGELEVALPLTRPVAAMGQHSGNDPRVFFSLAYRY
ncbi:MAG: ShlB/FhaC/HecB family hemolysin secretion/activation protein [Alphaproteobacteria bacterium]|nr:ShlB/FhaC/HecB family hemolysin secretion/activation protein [Alphaproteobacteria bacterium]